MPAPRLASLLFGFSVISWAQVNVLTSDYCAGRTGANLAEAQLTVANVSPGQFGLIGIFPVDGEIFGQPLYVNGVAVPGQGQRNLLLVTTEHNTVYAYDADSAASPVLFWSMNLGQAVPSSTVSTNAASGPFIDVNPEIGILSTPAVDPLASVVYVVAETLTMGGPVFQLHALDLATGQEEKNGPVSITAAVPDTQTGGQVSFDPTEHIQRPGLLLANGAVYVAFGSHADFGEWHGWLMSYDASDLTHPLGAFQTTPGGNGGAIWQSGRGLAADDAGNIYFVTGNGDYDGAQNFSESFLKVSGSDLSLQDWYTPANWQFLTNNDLDLSAGPALIPGTHLLFGGDKSGNIYLVNADSMGHLDTGGAAQVTQAVGGWVFSFAMWSRAQGTYVYLIDTDLTLKEFLVANGVFNPNPVSVSSPTVGTSRVGMALSANGGQDGTGILWVTTGNYFDPTVPAVLHAYDASNLTNELWNSSMSPADALGSFAKFASPTVANGVVYAASLGSVMVYGSSSASISSQTKPVISAVENSASYDVSAVSPGELVTIFGTNLGPVEPVGPELDDEGNFATTLAGVQVLVNGTPAPLLFAGQNQVNAVIPFGISSATAQVQITAGGQTSQTLPVAVQPSAPALFAADDSGSGQVLATNQDGTSNSADNPAPRGSTIVVYATGGGQTSPVSADGAVATADQPLQPLLQVSSEIGGVAAQVPYAGSTPGMIDGVLEVDVIVPEDVTPGPALPILLTIGGQSSQSGLTVAVQ
jgi:uncharacterized protein (TIGR03437 family)